MRLLQPLSQQGGVPAWAVALGFLGHVASAVAQQVGREHAPASGVQLCNQTGPQQTVAGISMQ